MMWDHLSQVAIIVTILAGVIPTWRWLSKIRRDAEQSWIDLEQQLRGAGSNDGKRRDLGVQLHLDLIVHQRAERIASLTLVMLMLTLIWSERAHVSDLDLSGVPPEIEDIKLDLPTFLTEMGANIGELGADLSERDNVSKEELEAKSEKLKADKAKLAVYKTKVEALAIEVEAHQAKVKERGTVLKASMAKLEAAIVDMTAWRWVRGFVLLAFGWAGLAWFLVNRHTSSYLSRVRKVWGDLGRHWKEVEKKPKQAAPPSAD